MSQPNIKVNYTDINGKRTSTTVSYIIAEFYYKHVLGNKFTNDDHVRDLIADSVNELIKEYDFRSKDFIEKYMLYKILNHRTK